MRPTAPLVWALLLPCILGKDLRGLPKLSNEHLNQTVVGSVVTTVDAEQAPQRTRRGETFPRLNYRHNVHLKWVEWSGSLPEWAVNVSIPATGRHDYICAPRAGCHWATGYYNPSRGPFCYNPCHGKEAQDSQFDVLVNEENLELLEWKALKGDLDNAVTSGIAEKNKVCVGKNLRGIGAVWQSILYLPWGGMERYYYNDYKTSTGSMKLLSKDANRKHYDPRNIQILTLQAGQYNQTIDDIQYHVDELAMLSQQPTTLNQMRVMNHNCRDIEQVVQLQQSTERQSTWEVGVSSSLTVSSSVTAGIPIFAVESGVLFTAGASVSHGNSVTERMSNSLTVTVAVPPNHSCLVKMAGKRIKLDIPFKAHLTKEYTNGRVHSTPVSGTYHGVQVGEIHAVAERCVPNPNAQPCPL